MIKCRSFEVSGLLNNSFLKRLLLVGLIFFLTRTSFAEEKWQFYRINAQFRGAVKKSFQNIGCAIAWFKDVSPGKTQVIAHVCAVNPEKKREVFSFRLNLLLGYNSDSIWITDQIYADFNNVRGSRENDVKQLACLWDYIRRLTINSSRFSPILNVAGRILNLEEKNLRNGREINCSWSGRGGLSGKFFLEKTGTDGWVLEKFRFRNGKVSVSLVQDSSEAISRDFRYKDPFARIVFDNK